MGSAHSRFEWTSVFLCCSFSVSANTTKFMSKTIDGPKRIDLHHPGFHRIYDDWSTFVGEGDSSGYHVNECIIPNFSKLPILDTEDLKPSIMARDGEVLSRRVESETFNAISRAEIFLVDILLEFRLRGMRKRTQVEWMLSFTYRLTTAMVH